MSDRLSASSQPDLGESYSELECLPYGVEQNDSGVCLLIRMGQYRILLDCGLTDISPLVNDLSKFSTSKLSTSKLSTSKISTSKISTPKLSTSKISQEDNLTDPIDLPLDFAIASHAHADHARGLLALHQHFPELPIYGSEVTSKLLPLNWTEAETEGKSDFCQSLPLRSPVKLKENLIVELFPAGHLPGATVILLTYKTPERTYKLLYTGDFFLSNSRLVEGLRLEELRGLDLDVLIIEGTYGTSRHQHRRNQENQLAERINRAIAGRSCVLLPTPALGLGQELLMLLRSHHHFTGRDLDIWVDGTVATGCDAYLELLPNFPPSVQNFARHQPLFWDERVRPRVRRLQPENLPTLGKSPCIVLTDSTAEISKYYQDENQSWLVLVPEKIDTKINHPDPEKLNLETYLLAEHSDGPGTTQLIHNLRPQHVIFVHGSAAYLADLTGLEELQNRYHLHSPGAGTLVELPIGETFLQPEPPETNYEGELSEWESAITISLPNGITKDPRWRQFADTGLVEARWQGEELVLRGLSPRELIDQNSERFIWPNIECCGTCKHQRGQRCWNPASPLYNFKVTLEGYCPAFERANNNTTES